MACAAALPAAIPLSLNGESGIAFVAACTASERREQVFPVGNVMLWGTVSTMFFRTRYAAVATAASSDAVLPNRLVQKVRPVMLRRDRVDRVVHAPCTIPMLI
jgi:hypothetical protein